MARKVSTVTVDLEGRDNGKTFQITEMSATAAEKWAIRALMALARSGVDMPEDYEKSGMAGLAQFGLRAFSNLAFGEAEPLLDEMFACVKIIPSPSVIRGLVEDDIEEVATRLFLRGEVLKLHMDFSKLAAKSTTTPA